MTPSSQMVERMFPAASPDAGIGSEKVQLPVRVCSSWLMGTSESARLPP